MDFPEEFSCYNESISSLSDLGELSEKYFSKVRVLHCPSLTSMQGIEFQEQLLDLNLSSNSIQRIEGLQSMSALQVLNLSCNNIRVINCLGGLHSLQKLNLSFNKISSLYNLRQVYGEEYCSFTHLDVRGNNIAQVNEVRYLSGCAFLVDVAFQGQSGTNPVCKESDYLYCALNSMKKLKFFDHQPVAGVLPAAEKGSRKVEKKGGEEEGEVEIGRVRERERERERERDIEIDNEKRNGKEKEKEKEKEKGRGRGKEEIIEENNTQDNKKLQQDLDELYDAYKELSFKYKNSEEYWSVSMKKVEESKTQMQYEKREVENECRRLRKKLSSRNAKIQNLKAKTQTPVVNTDAKDKALEELHYQMSNLMRDLGESQRRSQQALDDVYKKQEKLKLLERNNYELKNELKKMEAKTNQFHAQAIESSTNALKKYEELQKKYEDSLSSIEEKEYEIEVVKKKNMEILDLNAKFDENWSSKYREAVHSRENIISSLREELHKVSLSEKEKTQQVIYADKEENRSKIWELEQKLVFQLNEFKEKEREVEIKHQDILRENSDLKEMLRMSVEKECKSKDLISELTELIRQLQIQLDKEISERNSLKSKYEEKNYALESEVSTHKVKSDNLKSRLEVIEKDLNLGEDAMHIKNREIAKLKREIQDSHIIIEDLEEKLKALKLKLEKSEKSLTIEIEDLAEENKELEITIDTKNAIISDQAESIKELKALMSQYEQELDQWQSKRNSYQDNYENKLQDAYDEIEILKNKLSKTESTIDDVKIQIKELHNKKNELKEANEELQRQVQEKNDVLEFVEAEIANIKNEKDTEVREIVQEKNTIISDLKKFRDELTAKSLAQEKDIKEKNVKIKELETDLAIVSKELQREGIKASEMQDEIRALLLEMDNQKRQATEKISQLSKLFS